MSLESLIASLPPWPAADFSEFGEVEVKKLTPIQKLTGKFLGRNWLAIPHVTHHDEVDVTDAEVNRAAWNRENPQAKLTPVSLLVKALASALSEYPQFNASLGNDGQSIVLKKYFNIGVAVDTPGGLLVPVIRGVDRMSLPNIAAAVTAVAHKARTKGLSAAEMSGSSISLTSLGHIGGTAFTPIINAPDVAILGATAIQLRPAPAAEGSITWRKMLPLSLSYDHRVINGADAARFVRAVGAALSNKALFS
ncbi:MULTISPECIES: 2-oxo acid dehydrogenase subunit E2 [Sphingobium]|uniref:2-oxo acid dehydrogenase subunit E2 n=1 Tax=Sphingobium TaxID=165695 RepID=UPI00159C6492|nr:2-oxo acid dehydrogenase subunit E2 [Sphingobium sp. 15-1]